VVAESIAGPLVRPISGGIPFRLLKGVCHGGEDEEEEGEVVGEGKVVVGLLPKGDKPSLVIRLHLPRGLNTPSDDRTVHSGFKATKGAEITDGQGSEGIE